ncbi:hypothetical protein LAZ67_9001618 [Cordylochernes scorpioides]|uniref:Uncharacterized protein n=1 Tax=Cordylochernes scorpioides TaxID=51811 RepID=A0ABY6KT60_9ARAC|nr:hypothetical protein LAZ67_9001618 [Cordylochernes scorpioides]
MWYTYSKSSRQLLPTMKNMAYLGQEQSPSHIIIKISILSLFAIEEETKVGDETWIHNFDPKTKRQSTLWCSSKSPPPKKVRRARSVAKTNGHLFFRKVVSLIL